MAYADLGPQTVRCAYMPERDADGSVIGWVATIANITEAKRAETSPRNFAFLVQNASDFIGMCDLEFRPHFVNKAARALVGLDPDQDVRVFDFLFLEDADFLNREFFPKVMRDAHGSIEIRFRHFKTGEALWMEYAVVRMHNTDGRPTG